VLELFTPLEGDFYGSLSGQSAGRHASRYLCVLSILTK